MRNGSLTMSAMIPAEPAVVYAAWLSTKGHTAMTGSRAKASARLGATFTAWDGYIRGRNLELTAVTLIVQSWRTTEFAEDAPDSRLEVHLEAEGRGTRLTLRHTDLPPGEAATYRQGWKEFYFDPMKRHFFGR